MASGPLTATGLPRGYPIRTFFASPRSGGPPVSRAAASLRATVIALPRASQNSALSGTTRSTRIAGSLRFCQGVSEDAHALDKKLRERVERPFLQSDDPDRAPRSGKFYR
jgi:hypothetical protein